MAIFKVATCDRSWGYIPTIWGGFGQTHGTHTQAIPTADLLVLIMAEPASWAVKSAVFWASKNFGRETGRGYLSGNFWPSRNS